VHEVIELPFGVVSVSAIGVLDGGSDLLWKRVVLGVFLAHLFALHFGVHWKLFDSCVKS